MSTHCLVDILWVFTRSVYFRPRVELLVDLVIVLMCICRSCCFGFRMCSQVFAYCLLFVFVYCLCVRSLCTVFVYCPRAPLFVIFVFQYMSFSCRYQVDVVPSYRLSVGVIVSHVSRCLSLAEFVGSQVRVARRPVVLACTQPSYRLSRLRAFLSCRPGSW